MGRRSDRSRAGRVAIEIPQSVTFEEFADLYPSILVSLRYAAADLGLKAVCQDLDHVIARSELTPPAERSSRESPVADAAAERGRSGT